MASLRKSLPIMFAFGVTLSLATVALAGAGEATQEKKKIVLVVQTIVRQQHVVGAGELGRRMFRLHRDLSLP